MDLEIDVRSRPWRRRLGWLTWAVLEDVALSAHAEAGEWVAPVGARSVADNLGMTKDTAAKALAALAAEGIVNRHNVRTREGRTRSGYLINLPDGLSTEEPRDTESASLVVSESDGRDPNGSCPDRFRRDDEQFELRKSRVPSRATAERSHRSRKPERQKPRAEVLHGTQTQLFDPELWSEDAH